MLTLLKFFFKSAVKSKTNINTFLEEKLDEQNSYLKFMNSLSEKPSRLLYSIGITLDCFSRMMSMGIHSDISLRTSANHMLYKSKVKLSHFEALNSNLIKKIKMELPLDDEASKKLKVEAENLIENIKVFKLNTEQTIEPILSAKKDSLARENEEINKKVKFYQEKHKDLLNPKSKDI
ncbi:hypothetical protein [Shewanella sp. CAL98-MNA-CIBAN-0140]|uniref:hypothetical protein n=1 Tax=unclassified Shewanella TaxID=196818 RepID=UPI00332A194D